MGICSTLGCKFACGCAMLQYLPVNNFEFIKDNSQFNEGFIKNVMKKVMKGIFWSWCSIS